jgi:hypothetical protein
MTPRPELEAKAREIGHRIGGALPAGVGFALLVFDFGAGGNLAWISNGERPDMVNALKEFIVNVELEQHGGPLS